MEDPVVAGVMSVDHETLSAQGESFCHALSVQLHQIVVVGCPSAQRSSSEPEEQASSQQTNYLSRRTQSQ